MRISMMTYTMARGLKAGEKFDAVGLCEFCKKLDIDAIDWVTVYHYKPAELRRITDDYGLQNVVHTFFADFNFATAAERKPAEEDFKRGIETAVTLGAKIVMLPVGGKDGVTRDESRENYLNGLSQVMDFAKNAGVTVSLENFPDYRSPFINSDDMLKAIARIPDLRVTYDNGNCVTGGDTAAAGFTNVAEYVVHAHFKDWKECGEDEPGARIFLDGKYRRAVLVGEGDIDQMGSVKAMADYGYDGCVNFEYEGSEMTPRDATIEGVARMREWFAQAEA